ncbi:MAG: thioredoxin [Lachnospiraceae bacterium]|nr:thioredoxin [Lachnospiraceae bacterium]
MRENLFSGKNLIRAAFLLASVLLIAAGISKGDFFSVMIKGVNICLECIGIG